MHYKEVCTCAEQNKWFCTIACGVPMQHCANWVSTSSYLELQTFTSIYQDVPGLYLVCTRYVLVRTWKNQKMNAHKVEYRTVISCITSCALYHYATRVHSMVLSMVNTRYIANKTYTCATRYLLAAVVGRLARQQHPWLGPWRHWSRYQLEFPGCPCWLCIESARDRPWKRKLVANLMWNTPW